MNELEMVHSLQPLGNDEIAASAPVRLSSPPALHVRDTIRRPILRRRLLLVFAMLVALISVGTSGAIAINRAVTNHDFTSDAPVVTRSVAPSDAHWAKPGEHYLNLQSQGIYRVFREETAGIPLPPGDTYRSVYGSWIWQLTYPGRTQHTRTEIHAEATHEALVAWFRYWVVATPHERAKVAPIVKRLAASPALDQTLGDPISETDSQRATRAFNEALAGDQSGIVDWIRGREFVVTPEAAASFRNPRGFKPRVRFESTTSRWP